MPVKLICVGGARPNFMKLAPLMRALGEDPTFEPILVHTGQHYDEMMSGTFFRDLAIPAPKYNLAVGSGSHAKQTADIMVKFEPVLLEEKPAAVVVVGDVNSTIACAIVAKKLLTPVIHVEAGLRSFDNSMPEEINRLVTDSISDFFLVTEESGRRNLLREGVAEEKMAVVGNLMIDSLKASLAEARRSDVGQRLGLAGKKYGVLTLHRPANVDDPAKLAEILNAVREISQVMPIFFPIHPRTRGQLKVQGINPPTGVQLGDPLGYVEFLSVLADSRIVLTDSGGIQEETTVLGVPCLTLRENTERPVTVEQGTNHLAGTSYESILRAWNQVQSNGHKGTIPDMWDGAAAGRCVAAIRKFFQL